MMHSQTRPMWRGTHDQSVLLTPPLSTMLEQRTTTMLPPFASFDVFPKHDVIMAEPASVTPSDVYPSPNDEEDQQVHLPQQQHELEQEEEHSGPVASKPIFDIDWYSTVRNPQQQACIVAQKLCEMICYLWFATAPRHTRRAGADSVGSGRDDGQHEKANAMAVDCTTRFRPASPAALQFATSPKFVHFVQRVLETTQVSHSVIVLSLHYIYNYRAKNRTLGGASGSEYRVAIAGLMMANKFLDDNTYTNKTWSDVSGIPLEEVNAIEREFIAGLMSPPAPSTRESSLGGSSSSPSGSALYVNQAKYEAWHKFLTGLMIAKEAATSRHHLDRESLRCRTERDRLRYKLGRGHHLDRGDSRYADRGRYEHCRPSHALQRLSERALVNALLERTHESHEETRKVLVQGRGRLASKGSMIDSSGGSEAEGALVRERTDARDLETRRVHPDSRSRYNVYDHVSPHRIAALRRPSHPCDDYRASPTYDVRRASSSYDSRLHISPHRVFRHRPSCVSAVYANDECEAQPQHIYDRAIKRDDRLDDASVYDRSHEYLHADVTQDTEVCRLSDEGYASQSYSQRRQRDRSVSPSPLRGHTSVSELHVQSYDERPTYEQPLTDNEQSRLGLGRAAVYVSHTTKAEHVTASGTDAFMTVEPTTLPAPAPLPFPSAAVSSSYKRRAGTAFSPTSATFSDVPSKRMSITVQIPQSGGYVQQHQREQHTHATYAHSTQPIYATACASAQQQQQQPMYPSPLEGLQSFAHMSIASSPASSSPQSPVPPSAQTVGSRRERSSPPTSAPAISSNSPFIVPTERLSAVARWTVDGQRQPSYATGATVAYSFDNRASSNTSPIQPAESHQRQRHPWAVPVAPSPGPTPRHLYFYSLGQALGGDRRERLRYHTPAPPVASGSASTRSFVAGNGASAPSVSVASGDGVIAPSSAYVPSPTVVQSARTSPVRGSDGLPLPRLPHFREIDWTRPSFVNWAGSAPVEPRSELEHALQPLPQHQQYASQPRQEYASQLREEYASQARREYATHYSFSEKQHSPAGTQYSPAAPEYMQAQGYPAPQYTLSQHYPPAQGYSAPVRGDITQYTAEAASWYHYQTDDKCRSTPPLPTYERTRLHFSASSVAIPAARSCRFDAHAALSRLVDRCLFPLLLLATSAVAGPLFCFTIQPAMLLPSLTDTRPRFTLFWGDTPWHNSAVPYSAVHTYSLFMHSVRSLARLNVYAFSLHADAIYRGLPRLRATKSGVPLNQSLLDDFPGPWRGLLRLVQCMTEIHTFRSGEDAAPYAPLRNVSSKFAPVGGTGNESPRGPNDVGGFETWHHSTGQTMIDPVAACARTNHACFCLCDEVCVSEAQEGPSSKHRGLIFGWWDPEERRHGKNCCYIRDKSRHKDGGLLPIEAYSVDGPNSAPSQTNASKAQACERASEHLYTCHLTGTRLYRTNCQSFQWDYPGIFLSHPLTLGNLSRWAISNAIVARTGKRRRTHHSVIVKGNSDEHCQLGFTDWGYILVIRFTGLHERSGMPHSIAQRETFEHYGDRTGMLYTHDRGASHFTVDNVAVVGSHTLSRCLYTQAIGARLCRSLNSNAGLMEAPLTLNITNFEKCGAPSPEPDKENRYVWRRVQGNTTVAMAGESPGTWDRKHDTFRR
ncbi:hypothetical protein FISHEDRAFT_57776 [Fistulina hepatica ATCC 64428]|uniref:Cyclin-like domain-containing protein n=1 Tax=Fistulina hepatica ATCC 64428 TaxID=1128425 RepID=A0A0D7AGU0_9AGAR|nr:hypothetical protein FISHEDRAFT_57776 [Fistulina hepatica ATCC 64428]